MLICAWTCFRNGGEGFEPCTFDAQTGLHGSLRRVPSSGGLGASHFEPTARIADGRIGRELNPCGY